MIPVVYRKVWRDLWYNKGRTILVVLSIATGITALGMISSGNSRTYEFMARSHAMSHPAHVHMWLGQRVGSDIIASLRRVPGIENVAGVSDVILRWKPELDAEWQDINVITIEDFTKQDFDLIELREGSWPDTRSVAVEHNHPAPFGLPGVGGTFYLEINDRAREISVSGLVRDPLVSVPPFETRPSIYVTMGMMEQLIGAEGFDRLRISVPAFSEEAAEEAASRVENKLKRQGILVGYSVVQPPDEHWASQQIEAVGLILSVMAIASLFLSVVLVVNTINALMAQQISQIGIMKAIGGIRSQITALYLSVVLTYGFISVLIAVPLGAFAGQKLSNWILSLINVPTGEFSLNLSTVLTQVAAGLLVPLIAGLWPVLRGVAISVHTAISHYGVGGGRYGSGQIDRLLGRIHGLPRMMTLSLRNTFRRSGRVALTQIVLITAGAIFMMVVSTQYSFTEMVDEAWRSLGFDALIVFEKPQRIEEVLPIIEAQPNVEKVEMWLWWTATARALGSELASAEQRINLRAIPKDSVLYIPNLTAGRNLDLNDGRAILLNQHLATEMDVGIGDQIEFDFLEYGTSKWTIVGLIFDITNMQSTAYVHRDTLAKELNQVGRASVAEIQAAEASPQAQLELKTNLDEALGSRGYDISYSRTAHEDRSEAEAQFQIITNILMVMTLLIAIVGSIGLSGTLSINVIERQREIGVMRAIGASSLDVALIFIYEGLLLGILSWMVAIPLSIILGHPFVNALGEMLELPMRYQLAVHSIWIWLFIVTILSLIASWLPARRATRVSVNQSLSYE